MITKPSNLFIEGKRDWLLMKIFRFRPKNGLNFGDELGPYIVKNILNHLNLKSYPTKCDINFFSIGSVIHMPVGVSDRFRGLRMGSDNALYVTTDSGNIMKISAE